MAKVIRNSVFTLLTLALTAIGLHWNNVATAKNDPVQISQTVLSAATTGQTQDFPLTVSYADSYVKLGQTQTLQVATVPNVGLKIVTVYPNGQTANPQTLTAATDETGHYSLRFRINDFADLGLFETRVMATSNGQTSSAVARFVLQSLDDAGKSGSDGNAGYLYPLLP